MHQEFGRRMISVTTAIFYLMTEKFSFRARLSGAAMQQGHSKTKEK
jgi:hypothetical protein